MSKAQYIIHYIQNTNNLHMLLLSKKYNNNERITNFTNDVTYSYTCSVIGKNVTDFVVETVTTKTSQLCVIVSK